MRKSALILAISLLVPALVVSQESDPTIMTINGKEIKKSEFEYIYNKNKQQQLEQKTLDEYLEMFKDYKLKVMEAEANGIDTTQAFISELQGYRNQLAQPYLVDQEADEKLAQEAAFNRCVDFLVQMIEKYGHEVLAEIESSEGKEK